MEEAKKRKTMATKRSSSKEEGIRVHLLNVQKWGLFRGVGFNGGGRRAKPRAGKRGLWHLHNWFLVIQAWGVNKNLREVGR